MLTVNSINHLSGLKQTSANQAPNQTNLIPFGNSEGKGLSSSTKFLSRVKLGLGATLVSLFGLNSCNIVAPDVMDDLASSVATKSAETAVKDSIGSKTLTLAADTFSLAADSVKHIKK